MAPSLSKPIDGLQLIDAIEPIQVHVKLIKMKSNQATEKLSSSNSIALKLAKVDD